MDVMIENEESLLRFSGMFKPTGAAFMSIAKYFRSGGVPFRLKVDLQLIQKPSNECPTGEENNLAVLRRLMNLVGEAFNSGRAEAPEERSKCKGEGYIIGPADDLEGSPFLRSHSWDDD